ncbi:MAG TPA: glycoside hydrolase family 15 protein [Armatimonadota bacterium]|nr:glycoside hydrolase family 15 protein [Armatimonadota bacterium]
MEQAREDVALVGNSRVVGRVRNNGVLEDVFFPSKGFHRHILRSQFGVYLCQRRHMAWLADDWSQGQEYLEDTFVAEGLFQHAAGLEARLLDFVPPENDVFVRYLEVRNVREVPLTVAIVHAEAAALEENATDFGFNAAYVNRQKRVLRYRGHPYDNAREAHCCVLVSGSPAPDEFQVGRSYAPYGEDTDAFHDAADGRLQGNSLCSGQQDGATSAFLWRGTLTPGGRILVQVTLAGGMTTREAEERLKRAEAESAQDLLDQTCRWWRGWLAPAEPALRAIPTARLRRLARRSLLMLKLLQHEDGAFLAAPTLFPDYRYCWPRDAAYMAWMLSEFGYREEADRFFRWCADAQMANGFWHQNYYTDGRPHWTALQVDQVGTVLWALGKHLARYPDVSLTAELWPTARAAADALEAAIDPETGLLSSPQDLWEECGGTFAYTNAACAAALRAAADIAGTGSLPLARASYLRSAERITEGLRTALVQEGTLVAEQHPHRSHSARAAYATDISVVGLAVPYEMVDADWPPLARAVETFANSFSWTSGGMGRYPGDHFEGGHPWPLCSMWLAAYFLRAGDHERAMVHLHWALDQVTPLGHFPEQIHHASGCLVSALPLGWAHAWYLWLLRDLYPAPSPVPSRPAPLRKPVNRVKVEA